MSSEGMTIAEATQDIFWGVGVAPNLAQHTKPSKFLGRNQLGRLLMSLRDTVAARDIECQNDDFVLPSRSPVPHTTNSSVESHSNVDLTVTKIPPPSQSPPSVISDDSDHNIAAPSIHDSVAETEMKIRTFISAHRPTASRPTAPGSATPNRPPRKPKVKQNDLKNVNTMDKFILKDSPSAKRKLSSETISPTSVQVTKTIRTDGGDDVS